MRLMILPALTLLAGLACLAGQQAALSSRVMTHAARSDGDVVGSWQPNRGVTAGQRGYPDADETRTVVVSSGWLRAEFEEGRSSGGQVFRLTETPVKVTGVLRVCSVSVLVTAFVGAGVLAIVWRGTSRGRLACETLTTK
jgi:hypothetical protein